MAAEPAAAAPVLAPEELSAVAGSPDLIDLEEMLTAALSQHLLPSTAFEPRSAR